MSQETQRIDEGSRTSWPPLIIALVPAGAMADFRRPVLTVEDEAGIASGTRSA